MNAKIKITLALVFLFLLITSGIFCYLFIVEKQNSNRLFDNLQAATSKNTTFTTRDGNPAVKQTAQQLTGSEVRRAFPEVKSNLKNLYIPVSRTESFTQTGQSLNISKTLPLQDNTNYSVGNIEHPADSLPAIQPKTFELPDKWVHITGEIMGDSVSFQIMATDTIFTAIYRGDRRRPWLWVLSKRKLEVAATNRNPYIKIEVIQSGIIKN